MNRRTLIVSSLAIAAFALFAAWWWHTFERVEEDVPAPLRGEARYNPFYGLKKVLQARGFEVESRANLNLRAMRPGDNDTIVLGSDVRTLGQAEAKELLGWVNDGGSLVFALPPGVEGRGGDLLEQLGLLRVAHMTCLRWPSGASSDAAAKLEKTEKATTTDKANPAEKSGSTERAEAGHCFAHAFKLKHPDDSYERLLGDKEQGYWLGRRVRGDGTVTVLGDLQFLHTQTLKRAGHAAFAWQVLAPALQDGGKVHLVYAADVPPWHVLLVRHGWPALIPAVLALLAWLWARSQRFGPLLPLAAADRRALREHIQAAGEFTFRRGRGAALYAPLRRAFDERLRRDAPALAALEGDALIDALAQRSGHSPAAVRLALQPFNLAQPEAFFLTIKTLSELRVRP